MFSTLPVMGRYNVARCDHKLPGVSSWQLRWPDVAESDQKPFSVTFGHYATISCNLSLEVARSDQQKADIVSPVVTKTCQVWPDRGFCDQLLSLQRKKIKTCFCPYFEFKRRTLGQNGSKRPKYRKFLARLKIFELRCRLKMLRPKMVQNLR